MKTTTGLLAPALAYFALVFGAGFLLGAARVLWLVPRLGVRAAELLEMPLMLLVVFLAARSIAKQFAVPAQAAPRLAMGLIALSLLLAVEFTLVTWLQGMTIRESFANRDPVSASAYVASLVLFALMPLLLCRARHEHDR
jgi:hypothetical protein